jgi:hypothetical protein
MSDQQLLREVACHLLMGVALGIVFALVLLALNAQHLLDVIRHSAAPSTTLIIFVCGVAIYFGFGAAITGFHFVIMDDSAKRGR